MKKFIFSALLIFVFSAASFGARQFIEGTDYFVDFKQNDENKSAVLRVNFISTMPAPAEAESVLKDQMKVYAKILETEKENAKKEAEELAKVPVTKDKKKEKAKPKEPEIPKSVQDIKTLEDFNAYFAAEDAKDIKYKNIIGSVWYSADGTPENSAKINYSEDSSAFVWLEKTGKTVPFPDYIKFLKKEKDDKKQKEKERSQLLKQLLTKENAQNDEQEDSRELEQAQQ